MADDAEREEMTAKLVGIGQGPKRTVYEFENPKGGEHTLKLSAFNPGPTLEIGKVYAMTVEHKPMNDGSGKKYHNIARDGYNGPYLVAEIKQSPSQPAKPPQQTLPAATAAQPAQPPAQTQQFGQNDYWRDKQKADQIYHAEIRRQACLNTAVAYHELASVGGHANLPLKDLIKTAEELEARIVKAEPRAVK